MTDKKIDKLYSDMLKKYNFLGGKLIGAGGGGFFLMITNNKSKSIKLLQKKNIGYIDFMIDKKRKKINENKINKKLNS